MATALVTGGTSGIGYQFASTLAARGYDIVIAARDVERMERISSDLSQKYGVNVESIRADLSRIEDMQLVAERLEDQDRPIDLLINNAGMGLHAPLLDPDVERQRIAMDLMGYAVLVLSGAAGRAMKLRGHGQIINVASTSAWILSGNYSAIKAWVVSYTEALALELEDTGVTATALCPGWVRTEHHERAGVSSKNLPSFVWVNIDTLVNEALSDADKGKTISIPTMKWKIAMFVASHGPRAIPRMVSRKLLASRRRQKESS